MEKLLEALKKLLKPEEVNEVASAVKEMTEDSEKEIRAEYEAKLQEAYEKFSTDLKKSEETGETGYQQAYEIIMDLQKRLEEQKEEYEKQMEEGFEEAFQEIQKEKAKNENIEVELYQEFDKKLKEMKDFMVEKVDQFLAFQEAEIYEHAKRDVSNDPRLVEHKVALDRIVSIVADSLSDDDISVAASRKLEEAYKSIEDLKGQMRVIEARNIRLTTNNNSLVEQVRKAETKAESVITEATKNDRKEKAGKKESISGRGSKVVAEEIIQEFNNPAPAKDQNLTEGNDPLNDLLVLSGVIQS
jgi:uncharacterized protein YoxC